MIGDGTGARRGNATQKGKTNTRFPITTLASQALAGSALLAPAARGQAAGDTFTATASVESEARSGTARVRIAIEGFSTEAERDSVMNALVETNQSGAVVIEDYGAAKVWPRGVVRRRCPHLAAVLPAPVERGARRSEETFPP